MISSCFLEWLAEFFQVDLRPSVVLYSQDNTSALHMMKNDSTDHARKSKFLVNRVNCITASLSTVPEQLRHQARMEHLGPRHIAVDTLTKALVGILRGHCEAKLSGRVHDMIFMDAEVLAAQVAAKEERKQKEAARPATQRGGRGKHST